MVLDFLAVVIFVAIAYVSVIVLPLILLYFVFFGSIWTKTLFLSYVLFFWYDRRSGDSGGRGVGLSCARNWFMWKHLLQYFPIDLIKTVDLPSDRNYLICVFPHGILSFGAIANFCTNHSKWATLFPGIRPKLAALPLTTMIPIFREIVLSIGFASASETSLKALLAQSNNPIDEKNADKFTANGVGLVVGGIRECHLTNTNTYRLVLKNRHGFVRIALETGAALVPAISFGENDAFKMADVKPGLWRRLLELMFKKYRDSVEVLPSSMFPIRYPIHTVIGAPIVLEKTTDPSKELIYETHKQFCTKLEELFETHKSKYVENYEQIHLDFV